MLGTPTIHLTVFWGIMKTVILAALLVGIAVAISDKEFETFRPGKEYHYELNTQSVTGIPHSAPQFAGLGYNAKVTLQIGRNSRCTLQCSDIRFFEINDVVQQIPTHDFIPAQFWKPVEQETQQIYQDCLKTPIIFRYESGVIQSLEVSKDEEEWCTNLKKGVVSMFQMDLTQQNQLEDVDPKLADLIERNRVYLDNKQDQMYSTMEEDLDGDCESLYVVREPQQYSLTADEKDLKVTKIRNYENCRMRTKSEEGIFSTYVIEIQNPHNQTGLRAYTHCNASVQGSRRDFVIRKLDQLSEIFYTPLGEDSGEVATFSRKRLELQEVRDIVSVITPQYSTHVLPEGLKMKLKPRQQQQQQSPNQDRVAVIEQLLDEYTRDSVAMVSPKTLDTLSRIMYNLRECSAQDIISVLNNRKPEQNQQTPDRRLRVLLDVIPTIGRQQVVPVMKFLIEQDWKIVQEEFATMINYMALSIKPTPSVVEGLLPESPLFKLQPVQRDAQLRRAIILASGTVHHGLVKAQLSEPIPQNEFDEITKKFKNQIEALYQSTSDEGNKMAVMKAIGNCGLPDFIEFLRKELNNEKLPVEIRRNAVYAFRRMPYEVKERIHKILVPIFMNPNNEYGLRVVAYLGTVKSQPSYGTLQAIIHCLQEETSQRVGTFVYSHLQDIMDSSRLSLNETRRYVTLLMKKAKPFISTKFYSSTYSLDYLAEDLRIGEYVDFYVLDSERTQNPEGLAAIYGQTLYGREASVLEGGIGMSGLQEVLNRLVGPKSILSDLFDEEGQLTKDLQEVIEDLLTPQRSPDMGNVDALISEIVQKLGLSERQTEETDATAYLKVLGNEVRFGMLQTDNIAQYLKDYTRQLIDEIKNYMNKLEQGTQPDYTQSLATQSVLMFPTPLGIPCYFNASYSHVLRITGRARISSNPLEQKDEPFKLNIEVQPSAAVMLTGAIGLYLPGRRAGVLLQTAMDFNTNIPVEFTWDPQHQVDVKYYIPKDQNEIFHFQAAPQTHIDRLSRTPSQQPYNREATDIQNQKYIKPFVMQVPYQSPTFGVKFNHKVRVPTPILSFAPVRPFNGRHEYTCQMEPMTGSQEQYVEFKLTYTSQQQQQRSQENGNYRSSSSRTTSENPCGKLRPAETDPQLKNVKYSRYVCASVETKNTPSQRTYWSKFTVQRDGDTNVCQFTAQAESNGYQGLYNIVADVNKIIHPKKNEPEGQLVCKVEVECGKQNPKEFSGSVKVLTGDRKAELRVPSEPLYMFWMRKLFNAQQISGQSSHESGSWLSWLGMESDESRQQEDKSPVRVTTQLPELRNYAYKYTVEAEYEKIPEWVREYINYIYQYVKYTNQENVADIPKSQQHSQGKIDAIVRFMPSLEKLHVLLYGQKYETIFYCPARLPTSLKRALTLETELIFPSENQEGQLGASRQESKAKCSISQKGSKDKVTTFDGVEYELMDLPDCEIVLAKDCTSSQLFTVLGTKQQGSKKIRILVPGAQIDVIQQNSGSQEIYVNDQRVPLSEGEKRTEIISIDNKQKKLELQRTGETVEVKLRSLGLEVSIKRTKMEIKNSIFYSGEMCGICGDYNADVQREMTGAKNKLHKDPREFVLSYVLPSRSCDVEELKRRHNIQSRCERKRMNIVKTEQDGKKCVSIQPQETQSPECERSQQREQSVDFLCMDPESYATRRLLEDLQTRPQDLSTKVDRYSDTRTKWIQVPYIQY